MAWNSADAPLSDPTLAAKGDNLEQWIVPVEGPQITFHAIGTDGEQVKLKPLSERCQHLAVSFQVAFR